MPDITMCNNSECPLKEECYRFKAEPNPYRQSYFADNPKLKENKCEYFMKIFDKTQPQQPK